MAQWVTVLHHLGECNIPAASEPIMIKMGRVQGDSPLWYMRDSEIMKICAPLVQRGQSSGMGIATLCGEH